MALCILSQHSEDEYTTFKNVALVALNSQLFFAITEWAYDIQTHRIEVDIQKYSGTEYEEHFLMDIISREQQKKDRTNP